MAKQVETIFVKPTSSEPEDSRNLENSLRELTGKEHLVVDYRERQGERFYVLGETELPKLVRDNNGNAFYQLRFKRRNYVDVQETPEEGMGTLHKFPRNYRRRIA